VLGRLQLDQETTMPQELPFNFTNLTVPQKLDLIGRLWDSIPDSPGPSDIPEWHREIVEQRLAEADANPDAVVPWEQVWERLTRSP
jgi:putative addiction module component (TIGR02574 family)